MIIGHHIILSNIYCLSSSLFSEPIVNNHKRKLYFLWRMFHCRYILLPWKFEKFETLYRFGNGTLSNHSGYGCRYMWMCSLGLSPNCSFTNFAILSTQPSFLWCYLLFSMLMLLKFFWSILLIWHITSIRLFLPPKSIFFFNLHPPPRSWRLWTINSSTVLIKFCNILTNLQIDWTRHDEQLHQLYLKCFNHRLEKLSLLNRPLLSNDERLKITLLKISFKLLSLLPLFLHQILNCDQDIGVDFFRHVGIKFFVPPGMPNLCCVN